MNIQSVRNKFDLVQCFVIENGCDVLLLTETWLDDRETFLFDLENYIAMHSCRVGRGGGVAIYVKKTIKFHEIEKSDPNDTISWICVSLGERNLKISALYRPPSYNGEEFLTYLESILVSHPKNHFMFGDFNINLLDSTSKTTSYKNILLLNNFKIVNTVSEECATRVTNTTKSLIDHVISNNSANLGLKVEVKENSLSDHSLLLVKIGSPPSISYPKIWHRAKIVNYRRCQEIFKQRLATVNVGSFRELIALIRECKRF